MTSRKLQIASMVALMAVLAPRAARSDTKACVAAHASGQRETKAGHLKEAAQLYTSCGSDAACPEQLRAECAELLETVRRAVPSVIFSVLDERGADTSKVRVWAGDTLLADGLDGRAVELDPGKYSLRFVLESGEVLTQEVVIREGEKNRLLEARSARREPDRVAPVALVAPAPVPALPPAPPVARESSTPVGAWVATGASVLGFATFGTMALLGQEEKRALDACAPACEASERDTRRRLQTKYLIADIGLGVGAVSAVVATVLFVSSGGRRSEAAESVARHVQVGSSTRGASLMLGGDF